jgi:hypothetical protein
MPNAIKSAEEVERRMQAAHRLARIGFRVALAGSLLLFAPLAWVMPQFIPFLFRYSPTAGSFWLPTLYVLVLVAFTASQAFRREHHDAAAGVARLGLILGLLTFVPYTITLARQVFQPGVTFTTQDGELVPRPIPVPNWSALADPLALLILVGLLLVVVGNIIAVIGEIRRGST